MGGKRKHKKKPLKNCILIYTQGEKTEKIYFESFKKRASDVVIRIITNPVSPRELVEYARRDSRQPKHGRVIKTWCVFDKDDTLDGDFNEAIIYADKSNIDVAYSIECFELWILLHFENVTSPLTREKYIERLSFHLGIDYSKSDEDQILSSKTDQIIAIKRAKKLHRKMRFSINFASHNPITTVFELVEFLEEYS